MMMAFVPAMAGMPKAVLVPNAVFKSVAPPAPSKNARSEPTVAVRLLLLKSHWPKGWAWALATTKKLATIIALQRRRLRFVFMDGLGLGWLSGSEIGMDSPMCRLFRARRARAPSLTARRKFASLRIVVCWNTRWANGPLWEFIYSVCTPSGHRRPSR